MERLGKGFGPLLGNKDIDKQPCKGRRGHPLQGQPSPAMVLHDIIIILWLHYIYKKPSKKQWSGFSRLGSQPPLGGTHREAPMGFNTGECLVSRSITLGKGCFAPRKCTEATSALPEAAPIPP